MAYFGYANRSKFLSDSEHKNVEMLYKTDQEKKTVHFLLLA